MKTKIKTIEAKFYQSKPNGFKVVLDDGTGGNLAEKDSDKDFKNGDEVEATIADYISKAGKHSNLITLKHSVSEMQQKSSGTETKGTPPKIQVTTNLQTLKGQATIKAMEFMINAFIADKLTWDQIQPKFKELAGYLVDAINDCAQE